MTSQLENSYEYNDDDTTDILKNKIRFLVSQLRLERFKSRFFHNLIKQNTSIIVDDIMTEEEDGIHVYNTTRLDGNIQVFIHDCIKNEDGLSFTHLTTPNRLKNIELSKSISKSASR